MAVETTKVQIRLRAGLRKFPSLTDERDEEEVALAARSFERSITPKFILSKEMKIPETISKLNIKPVFKKLEKKVLTMDEEALSKVSEKFDDQLKTYQGFSKINKKKPKVPKVNLSRAQDSHSITYQTILDHHKGELELNYGSQPMIYGLGASPGKNRSNVVKTLVKEEHHNTQKDWLLLNCSKGGQERTASFSTAEFRESFQQIKDPESPLKPILKKGDQVMLWKSIKSRSKDSSARPSSLGKKVRFSKRALLCEYLEKRIQKEKC